MVTMRIVCNSTKNYKLGERKMPYGDRTGPENFGPKTGRRLGYCAEYESPGYTKRMGMRMGMGRGSRGGGRGRRGGWRGSWGR